MTATVNETSLFVKYNNWSEYNYIFVDIIAWIAAKFQMMYSVAFHLKETKETRIV